MFIILFMPFAIQIAVMNLFLFSRISQEKRRGDDNKIKQTLFYRLLHKSL